jgi:hypothetical protein
MMPRPEFKDLPFGRRPDLNLELPPSPYGVLVRRASEAQKLSRMLVESPEKFAVKPRSVIPLEVICQGLLK